MLLLCSGSATHNLGEIGGGRGAAPWASRFLGWMYDALVNAGGDRSKILGWQKAPEARRAHPREEHLAPVFVAAGSSNMRAVRRVYTEVVAQTLGLDAYSFDD